jgi:pyruvate formate lyase activating enzyme
MKEALFYKKEAGLKTKCLLCPRSCLVEEGKAGVCGVRKNIAGIMYSMVYARPCATSLDPIEKKPLFHFLPGETTLGIATIGCNLLCKFCQNWHISSEHRSQGSIEQDFPERTPEEIVELCHSSKSRIISYTYTEPTIFYEYALDTAILAKKEGVRNVLVTNGYINEKPLRKLCKYIDAANVDLKGFSEEFYRVVCRGTLEPVLKSLKLLKEEGVWVEITNLVIPGLNDKDEDFEKLSSWIEKELGREVPLHLSRYHPDYKMLDTDSTPLKRLEDAKKICMKHLDFVYVGNVTKNSDTVCPGCGSIVIKRAVMGLTENNMDNGRCPKCNRMIPGVWK